MTKLWYIFRGLERRPIFRRMPTLENNSSDFVADTDASASAPAREYSYASAGIIDRIRTLLQDEGYKPGDKLPSESQLVRQFGVSHNTVRAAIHTLAAMGVVETSHGARSRVATVGANVLTTPFEFLILLDRPSYEEMHEMRTHLELELAVLAAQRRTDADIAALEAIMADLIRLNGTLEVGYANRAFHEGIAHASRNTLMERTLSSLLAVRSIYFREYRGSGIAPERNDIHRRILDGIIAADPAAARAAMNEDMEYALELWGRVKARREFNN